MRTRHDREHPDDSEREGGDDANLERLRQQADDFLAAGDAAIERALSSDSEAFLRSSRQLGGQ
ncbi:MAG: hypothetical protein AB7R55_07275 [Gemmatimonadales bacterium]